MIKYIIVIFLISLFYPVHANSCEDWDFLITRIAHVESRHNPTKSLEKAVTIWNGKKNQKYINNMFNVKNCKRCTDR